MKKLFKLTLLCFISLIIVSCKKEINDLINTDKQNQENLLVSEFKINDKEQKLLDSIFKSDEFFKIAEMANKTQGFISRLEEYNDPAILKSTLKYRANKLDYDYNYGYNLDTVNAKRLRTYILLGKTYTFRYIKLLYQKFPILESNKKLRKLIAENINQILNPSEVKSKKKNNIKEEMVVSGPGIHYPGWFCMNGVQYYDPFLNSCVNWEGLYYEVPLNYSGEKTDIISGGGGGFDDGSGQTGDLPEWNGDLFGRNGYTQPGVNEFDSYPINIQDIETIEYSDFEYNIIKNDLSNSTYVSIGNDNLAVFSNNILAESYPDNHPVSLFVKNFNPYIFYSFQQSNNTSLKQLHETSKGTGTSDGYGKGIGAIGEGLFAQRLSIPPIFSTRVQSVLGAKIYDNSLPPKITYVDLITEQDCPENQYGYSFVDLNFTDLNGSPTSKRLSLRVNNQSYMFATVRINKGLIAYEVKTYNPSNDESVLFKAFTEGVNQTIKRALIKDITAGVLVFDYDSFQKIYNSPVYKTKVESVMNQLKAIKKYKFDQAVFLRLERNLWRDSNNAYHSILDQIRHL
jgi:hypothetical protein